MAWARILAHVTGTVDQELLRRNEYLVAENRIMKAQLKGRLKQSDAERGALLHDRDTFRAILVSGRVEPLALPARSPNLNAYAERWVRSVKEECLSKVILFGERSLRRALSEYVEHFHAERNHQGKGNVLLFPRATDQQRERPVRCRERLGGLPRYYHREVA